MITPDMFEKTVTHDGSGFTLRVVSPKYNIERVWDGKDFTKGGNVKACKYVTKKMKAKVKYYKAMGHKVIVRYF